MSRSTASIAIFALALVVATTAQAGTVKKLTYEETLPNGAAAVVTLTVRAPASFQIVLQTSTRGRTRLFLTGATAPKGGPLIDTRTYACEGTAGSFFCRGAYEPLPKGTYSFRVRRDGPTAPVRLTVRW